MRKASLLLKHCRNDAECLRERFVDLRRILSACHCHLRLAAAVAACELSYSLCDCACLYACLNGFLRAGYGERTLAAALARKHYDACL